MTRAEHHLRDLRNWYSVGLLSWETFFTAMVNALLAERAGWGQERY